MTERKLSTLGYLMDRLGLSTAALARRLHVDASLVSKWRSGSRRLSAKSVYFDEVCRMLLEQNPMALTDALRSLVPLEEPKREEGDSRKRGDGSLSKEEEISGTEGISGGSSGTEALLYRVLNDRHFTVPKAFTIRAEALCTAEIAIYRSNISVISIGFASVFLFGLIFSPSTWLLFGLKPKNCSKFEDILLKSKSAGFWVPLFPPVGFFSFRPVPFAAACSLSYSLRFSSSPRTAYA